MEKCIWCGRLYDTEDSDASKVDYYCSAECEVEARIDTDGDEFWAT